VRKLEIMKDLNESLKEVHQPKILQQVLISLHLIKRINQDLDYNLILKGKQVNLFLGKLFKQCL
jgi:hypothetical protein